jgi:hypothetical protein
MSLRYRPEFLQTLSNTSSTNSIFYAAEGDHQYAYFAPPNRTSGLEYRASTIASETVCIPQSQACQLNYSLVQVSPNGTIVPQGSSNTSKPVVTYNCSKSVMGDFFLPSTPGIFSIDGGTNGQAVYFYFSSDDGFTPEVQDPSNDHGAQFYWGLFASIPATNFSDPEYVSEHDIAGTSGIILGCRTSIFNFTYSLINGSISDIETTIQPKNYSFTFTVPIEQQVISLSIQNLINGLTTGLSSSLFAASFASQMNTLMLATLAGIISPRQNLLEQSVTTKLVSKVPKAPYFTLISLIGVYILFGILVAVFALCSSPSMSGIAQNKLTVFGLASFAFETQSANRKITADVKDLYAEHEGLEETRRVGIRKAADGGWDLAITLPTNDTQIPLSDMSSVYQSNTSSENPLLAATYAPVDHVSHTHSEYQSRDPLLSADDEN